MLGIGLILVSVLLIGFEQHARIKRKKLSLYQEIVYTDLKSKKLNLMTAKESAIDSIALGIGASTLNIMDIYAATEEHSEVLEILQYRFPDQLSSFDSSMDWFNKIESLKDISTSGTYASAFKGQTAEKITTEYLTGNGFTNVGDFDSRVHPDNDVFGEFNGETIEVSVKNGSADYIRDMIEKHPNSDTYAINVEAYKEMLDSGEIDSYADQGITIFSPGFSEEVLSNQGSDALIDIHDAGDLIDDIPYLAVAIFGVKLVKNIQQLNKGNLSTFEFGSNVAVDAGRVASGGVFAVGGSKIGAAVGTFVAPGIGTLIGGGIGAVAGAFAGGALFSMVKEHVKWGNIINAIDYFAEKYSKDFSKAMKTNMTQKYSNIMKLNASIRSEEQLIKAYSKELNPYSLYKVTLNSVIVAEHYNNLHLASEKLKLAINNTSAELFAFCIKNSKKVFPDEEKKQMKFARRLFGNIIIDNEWLIKNEDLTDEEIELINKYKSQLIKAPNHAYRLDIEGTELFDGMFYHSYDKTTVNKTTNLKNYGIIIYVGAASFLILAGYLFFR